MRILSDNRIKQNNGTDYDSGIDVLKGIALFGIMLGHTGHFSGAWLMWEVSFAVPCFYILAGFLAGRKIDAGHLRVIIKKRAKRLLLPYLGYNALLLVFYTIINRAAFGEILRAAAGIAYSRFCLYFPADTPDNIHFLFICNSPLWFLTSLFVSELLFSVIVIYLRKNKQLYVLSCLLLLGVSFLLCRLPVLLPWSLDTAGMGALFMIGGYEYGKYRKERKGTAGKYRMLLLLPYGILMILNKDPNMSVRTYGPFACSILLFLCSGITGTLFFKEIADRLANIKAVGSFFRFIGRRSLPILALHYFIFCMLDEAGRRLNTGMPAGAGLGFLKVLIAVILCYSLDVLRNLILIRRNR